MPSSSVVLASSVELNSARITFSGIGIDVTTVGKGRPLLFLHGTEGPTFPSDEYLHELARDFRVIAPWHPGFGGSDLPKHFRKVDDLAYFYLDLAEQLNLRDAVLVGSAFGGWIAAEMMVRSPDRFSHLVLVDAFGVKVGDRETRDIVDMYAVSRSELARLTYVDKKFQDTDLSSWSIEDLTKVARGRESLAFFGWQPYMHNPQLKNWLHRINLPTLVLWGEEDKVVSRDCGRAYTESIPQAKFELISDAGHYPHVEQPKIFADKVLKFITQNTLS
jgi:pimeloyl-ACP methyl ester carboxylesterase